jgi:putative DNA primase/helicase
VFIFYGAKGNNGKTTLLNVFRELLGKDYSGQLVIDTVMSMRQQDATTRADLADLRGLRLVVTSEVEKEHKLNEGKIKYITAGMGSIKSCRKYENPIEFEATHKLFMDCNYRPVVRGVDDAIWRRLKLIPFESVISEEEKDLQLPDKLRTELPGVLAWAVRGCLAWQQEGLGDPPEVSEAGLLWRQHDDPLKEFLEDCCALGPELFVRCVEMSAGYEVWCRENREKYPLGKEALGERLMSKGFTQSRSRRDSRQKQMRTWEGVQLNSETEGKVRNRGGRELWTGEE